MPRHVRLIPTPQGWRLDLDALAAIDPKPVQAALLMSPSMPTGAVFTPDEWQALIAFCQRAGALCAFCVREQIRGATARRRRARQASACMSIPVNLLAAAGSHK